MAKEQPQTQTRQLVRLFGTDVPGNQTVKRALGRVKGIGRNLAHSLSVRLQLDPRKQVGSLTDNDLKALETDIRKMEGIESWMFNRQKDYESGNDKHLFTTDLKFVQQNDIKRLQKVRTYRGLRHAAGLPVRGQRTKAHFRKGRAVGVTKVKAKPGTSA